MSDPSADIYRRYNGRRPKVRITATVKDRADLYVSSNGGSLVDIVSAALSEWLDRAEKKSN